VAVISEADIAARSLPQRGGALPLRVADIALRRVERAFTTDCVSTVLRLMRAARVRYVALVDERAIMKGAIGFEDIRLFLCAQVTSPSNARFADVPRAPNILKRE
jgi:CBS domain-containing protein